MYNILYVEKVGEDSLNAKKIISWEIRFHNFTIVK